MAAPNFFGSNHLKSAPTFDMALMGGSDFIDDTNAHTRETRGGWNAIQAVATAVATVVDSGTTKTSVPLPAGIIIYGQFTSITLASGKVMAYRI